MTTTRYALDTDRARAVLTMIAKAEAHDDRGGPELTAQEQAEYDRLHATHGIDGVVYIESLDPSDSHANNDVHALIQFAYETDLVTGPSLPQLIIDDDSYLWRIDLGEYPAAVRLTSPWEEIRKLGRRDTTGAERALSILEDMVSEANAVLNEHDNYLRAAVHLATCAKGAERDRRARGYDHTTATNPRRTKGADR